MNITPSHLKFINRKYRFGTIGTSDTYDVNQNENCPANDNQIREYLRGIYYFILLSRKPRSSSMPYHSVDKIPQAFRFYKKYGKCKLAASDATNTESTTRRSQSFIAPFNLDEVQMQENQFQEVWDHKTKL